MNNLFKRITLGVIVLLGILLMTSSSVNASQIADDQMTFEQCMTLTENDKEACEKYEKEVEEKSSSEESKSNKMMKPFLSNDEEVKEIEKKQKYYNYFWEAHFVKNASEFDDKLFAIDTPENFGVMLITIIANIFMILVIPINLINMVLISLYLNGSIVFLFDGFTTYINDYILEWSNPTGIGITLTGVIGIFALVVKVLKMVRSNESLKEITKIIMLYVVIIIAIPLTYINVSPLENKLTDSLIDTVTSSVSSEELNTTVDVKNGLFESTIMTGWMYRHLGVTTVDDLAAQRNITYDEANLIVENMLKDDNETYKNEYDSGNTYLATNFETAFFALLYTIIWCAHDILMLVIVGFPTILMFLIDIIFVFFKAFIWVGLFSILIKVNEDISIMQFILNRFVWYLLYISVYVIFILFLKSIFALTSLVVKFDISLILIYDILLIILLFIVYKQRKAIMEVVKNIMANAGKIITGNGNYSAQQFLAESKEIIMENKESIINIKKAEVNNNEEDSFKTNSSNDDESSIDNMINSSTAETSDLDNDESSNNTSKDEDNSDVYNDEESEYLVNSEDDEFEIDDYIKTNSHEEYDDEMIEEE